MPIYRPEKTRVIKYSELLQQLVAELNANQETESAPSGDAPYIIEESNLRGGLHMTILWDRFEEVPTAERGRLILDAIKQSAGEAKMLETRLALGLTLDEAKELGLLERLPGNNNK